MCIMCATQSDGGLTFPINAIDAPCLAWAEWLSTCEWSILSKVYWLADKTGIVCVIKSKRITQIVSNSCALLCILQVLDERCCKIRRFTCKCNSGRGSIYQKLSVVCVCIWHLCVCGCLCEYLHFLIKSEIAHFYYARTYVPEMRRKWREPQKTVWVSTMALIEFYFRPWIFSRTIWQSIKSPSNRNGINSMLMTGNYNTKQRWAVFLIHFAKASSVGWNES